MVRRCKKNVKRTVLKFSEQLKSFLGNNVELSDPNNPKNKQFQRSSMVLKDVSHVIEGHLRKDRTKSDRFL